MDELLLMKLRRHQEHIGYLSIDILIMQIKLTLTLNQDLQVYSMKCKNWLHMDITND